MLIAMGVFLVAAIVWISLTAGGSAAAVDNAAGVMWDYIDENYPDVHVINHGEKPEYLGAASYSLLVSDGDCGDICFRVLYTDGNISDDYYHKVTKKTNILLRLEKEMGAHMGMLMLMSDCDILRTEVTFPPRVRNDIPESIYPGVEFDPSHPIYRGSTLMIICYATDDMARISETVEKAHGIASENGIMFSYYSVYGMESDDVYMLEIDGIRAEAVESGYLTEILISALTGEYTVSDSDLEGVFAGIYYCEGSENDV